MLEIVEHVHLLVPLARVGPRPAQVRDLSDLPASALLVEVAHRGVFAGELAVTGALGPDQVVEIAEHARKSRSGFAVEYPERLHGRAVVVEVERDEAHRIP